MHSPGVSRLLSELGHEVIVAHAHKVRLIGESRKKDGRLDARTLARLARIDPQLTIEGPSFSHEREPPKLEALAYSPALRPRAAIASNIKRG
jgi:transposase